MQKQKATKKHCRLDAFRLTIIAIFAVLVILLIVASFEDWNIDKGMYQGETKSFGNYTSWIAGMVFFLIGAFVSGFIIAKPLTLSKQYAMKRPSAIGLSIALLCGLTCLNAWNFKDAVIGQMNELVKIPKLHDVSWLIWNNADGSANHAIVVSMSVGLAFAALLISTISAIFLMSSKNPKISSVFTFKWAFWALLTLFTATLVVTKMKDSMPRARFFQFYENSGSADMKTYYNTPGEPNSFRNWWEVAWNPSTDADGKINSGYTSFPSGHTTWIMSLVVFVPVIMGLTQNSVKRSLYLCGIAVVVLFIMMSRLSAGRHFLSDVTVAVLFNSAIYAAGRLAFKKLNI